MTNADKPVANKGYHAHIYYDPAATRPIAEKLCAVIAEKFEVKLGGLRDGPVGPHPVANAQVIFTPDQFQRVVEWLMFHREGLDVLIHPLSDDSVDDHSIYALWLGSPVPLKLETLRRNYRSELLPNAEMRS
jgi:aromatic ring-cleaving dioxygenase